MTTKWDLLSEQDRKALDAIPLDTSCNKCGTPLKSESDFARHFVLEDERYLNIGNCPVTTNEWPMVLSQGNAWIFRDQVPVINPDAEGRNGMCRPTGCTTTDGTPTFSHTRDYMTGKCSCGGIDIPWPPEPEYDDRPHGEFQPMIDAIESRADAEYADEMAGDPGDPYDY